MFSVVATSRGTVKVEKPILEVQIWESKIMTYPMTYPMVCSRSI